MSARRTRRLLLVAAATVAAASPPAALAHARLERTVPAAGAVIPAAPREVKLVFDDAVQPAGGNAVVRNADGASVLGGAPRLERGGRVLVLPLRALGEGDYSVRWRALSDDGHFVSGVLAFAVGAGRASPQAVLRAASGSPSPRDVTARWLLFAGLLSAAGTVAFSYLAFRPALRGLAPERQAVAEHVEWPRFCAIVFAGCVLFAAGAGSFVHRSSWDTRFGAALVAGLVVALVGAACAGIAVVARAFRLPAAACALALAAVPSFAGHALDHGRPWPSVIVDLLHVAAAAVWTGGLLGLVVVVPAAIRAAGAPLARAVVPRASALALAAVAVLAATGVVRAVFELRALDQLWTTGYGRALLVKSGLLLVLVALGWANRARLGSFAWVRRNARAELVLIAGVVVAVAFLTQLRPGRDIPRAAAVPAASASFAPPPPPPRGALVLAQEDGALAVALAVTPTTLTASVLAPTGGGADGLDVSFTVPPRGPVEARPCGHGCYRAETRVPRPSRIRVVVGRGSLEFAVPRSTPPADMLLERATRAFRRLRSVEYVERLASDPRRRIVTRWRLEAPDRIAYAIRGGADAVLIGNRRWDRTRGGAWQRSAISPLEVPLPTWGTRFVDARLIEADGSTAVVSWANPQIPAWFTARFDRRTLRPLELRMTAAAHFMRHRYVSFNRPLGIRPPR